MIFFAIILAIAVALIAYAALGLILAPFIVMLWNACMPEIFGLPEIDYWTAYSLYLLSVFLFGRSSSSSSS